ncbi:hypothetical protein FHT85_002897 [Rhizobium sp. BK312]|jgi:hypothetical protein|uniref:hypothetical protein n=1 Tax=Rhizobium sp. BK312 TaxID=2587080 RepID=UPI000DD2F0A6|nr:hypothetical protein [Rhizobium sp. BK312]MBB3425910.1 hypothetical protein [Rhizobium sp. BK312]
MIGAAAYVDPRHEDFHLQIRLALPPYYLGPCGRQATTIRRQNFRENAKIVFATVIFLRNRPNIPTENTLMSAFEIKKCPKGPIGLDISSVFSKRTPYGSLRVETGDCGRVQRALPRLSKES